MIPLEKQVVSLELAKRLKELGVKQESLFFWMSIKDDDGKDCWAVKYGPLETFYGIPVDENISAFTVAELGEMLPYCIEKNGETFYFGTGKGKKLDSYYPEHEVSYSREDTNVACLERADTEADARAKVLIYLVENKLVTL